MRVQFVPIHQAVAQARAEHRPRITEVQRAGIAAGRRHDGDVVALLLAAATDPLWHPDGLTHWTRPSVNHYLKCDVWNWCSFHRCLLPEEGLCEALWDLLGVLHDTGRLDDESDDLTYLREPLICYGGLGLDGNQRPLGPSSIPCACYWPVGREVPDPMWEPDLGRRRA